MHPRYWYWTAWTLILVPFISASRPFPTLRFITTPKDSIVNETSNAVLPCNATNGQLTYAWLFNGSLISLDVSSTSKYVLANGHDLVVLNIQRHLDNGFYRCRATNEKGSILSNEALIQVAYFDVLESPSTDRGVITIWESTKLSAPVVNSFPPAKVVWKKNTKLVNDGDSGDCISSDGGLYIIGASTSDYGVFTCTVKNLITQQTSTKTYDVRIKGIPNKTQDITTMKAPDNQTTRVGSNLVIFECIVTLAINKNGNSTHPVASQITWYINNTIIDVASSSKYGYIRNDTSVMMKLIVYKPKPTDSGVFKCQATGISKVITHEATLVVLKAKVPLPTCTAHLQPVKNVIPGERIEIKCPEDDRDLDDITCIWYKNAVPITYLNDSRVHEQDESLVIDGIASQDSGLYQVALRNGGGECIIEIPMYLKVEDSVSSTPIPRPPMTIMTSSSSVLTSSIASTAVLESTTASTPPATFAPSPSITPTTANTIHPSSTYSTSNENNGTVTENPWTTTGDVLGTTQPLTEHNPKRSVNIFTIEFVIWIASGSGGFILLVLVVIVTIYCCCVRKKRKRKRSFNVNGEGYDEFEMNCVKRTGKSPGGQLADKNGSHGNLPGVDTKRLLNDEEDVMYAPVLALDNIAVILENDVLLRNTTTQGNHRPQSAHVYEEPITKTQRKPYNKPLPTIPREDKLKPRTPSTHSYLELLGPDQYPDESTRTATNEETVGDPEKPLDECLYDCARDGVLTNTLIQLTSQPQNNYTQEQQPLYHVLEGSQADSACSNRESTLYANPEDILPASTVQQEPLYHVLEPSRPESLYQPLVDYNSEVACEQPDDDNIYQPLDKKARSTSAPSSILLNNKIKPKRSASANQVSYCEDILNNQYSIEYEDELYQPLNNTDRCPLNVSKPKNTSLPRGPVQGRKGSIPYTVDLSSLKDYEDEPTLHAIDVSPKGSLKEGQSAKQSTSGYPRKLSLTHTIVNISRLTQRRASEGETLGLRPDQDISRLHRRNHSDAGLCPIDLSLLRVSIDFESDSPSKPDGSRYMPLVKPSHVADDENVYSTVEDGERTE